MDVFKCKVTQYLPEIPMLASVSCRRSVADGLGGNSGTSASDIVESSLFVTKAGFCIFVDLCLDLDFFLCVVLSEFGE